MNDLEQLKGMYLIRPEEEGWRIIAAHLKEDAEVEQELKTVAAMAARLKDELAQVREAANAEMKASLGYQAELAELVELVADLEGYIEELESQVATLGHLYADMSADDILAQKAENTRLRATLDSEVEAHNKTAERCARLREERDHWHGKAITKGQDRDIAKDNRGELEDELARLREQEARLRNELAWQDGELARLRDDANEEIQAAHDERDKLREALEDIRANGSGRDFDAAARADDALKETT